MNPPRQSPLKTALLLGGGGARAAYQVGVLKAVAEIVPSQATNPFPIICGTSAGSINTAALASNAKDFQQGVQRLIDVWSNFELDHVFYADGASLSKRIWSWFWCNIGPGKWHKGPASLLNNQPLRELLEKSVNFEGIRQSIDEGHLHAYCVNACSYTSGESIAFFNGHQGIANWKRNHRQGVRQPLTVDHLMASSAIPVIFPSVRLNNEYFGDGSMRQISPISPALHLGADRLFIIGLRRETELGLPEPPLHRPTLGQISGYVLDTLFLNSLFSDIERMQRINRTLEETPNKNKDGLKRVEHLIISPSTDIAEIARQHFSKLPPGFRRALKFMGMGKKNSRRFISYLMFTKPFCQDLIELGYQDAMQQQSDIHTFLTDSNSLEYLD